MEEQTPSKWKKFRTFMRKHRLTYLMLSSVILGFVTGIIIQTTAEPLSKDHQIYLYFVGEILIRMLKCAAVPLIVACIVVAVSSLDLVASGTIAWQMVLLLFAMKIVAACIGIAAVMSIHPGRMEITSEITDSLELKKSGMVMDIFLDLFFNLIPNNMMRIYLQQYETRLTKPNGSNSDNMMTWEVGGTYIDTMNLLGMIFIAIIIGLTLNISQEKEKGLAAVASEVYSISMSLATWIVWSSPVFLFFLVMTEIMNIDDVGSYLRTWGFFILTMHAGIAVILLVQYTLVLFLVARVNPFKFYSDMTNALITAYVTASSIATMPVTIECLLKHGIDERIVRFVVPIGSNLNKIGSACYFPICLIFVAQMLGAELFIADYFTIAVLSVLSSMLVPAVPFSGIAVIIMLLNTLGLKQNLVAGILAVEWLNDRIVTVSNVLGNCIFPKILEKWNRKLLEKMDNKASEKQ